MTQSLTGNPHLIDPGFQDPPASPLLLFQRWLEEAERLEVKEPRALVLSTANKLGRPSSRVVFLRTCDETGIIFATGENSAKGQELASNPWAAGTLWWPESVQQINFQGQAFPLPPEKSDEIFQSRTREAQSVAATSQQSSPLTDEADLKRQVTQLINSTGKIDRPQDWHAYHITIETIEFWHGSTDRFHKRLSYELINKVWRHQYLQP
jgi:pyridoxamine-phosphate oxidase